MDGSLLLHVLCTCTKIEPGQEGSKMYVGMHTLLVEEREMEQ